MTATHLNGLEFVCGIDGVEEHPISSNSCRNGADGGWCFQRVGVRVDGPRGGGYFEQAAITKGFEP